MSFCARMPQFALSFALMAAPLIAGEPPSAPSPREKDAKSAPVPTATAAAPRIPRRLPTALAVDTPQQVFRIECRIVERDAEGRDKVIAQPTVATVARRPAHVQIAQATPLVTGAEPTDGGAAQPNITVVTTGLSLAMTVAPDRPGRAAFDVSIERSDIESVDVTKHADGSAHQSARVTSSTTRVLDNVALGKKFVVGIDDKDPAKSKRRAEFVVAEFEAE